MLLKLLYIEHKKTKRSFAFWLTIFGSMVIPMVVSLVMLVKPAPFVPFANANPWKSLVISNFAAVSSFLFPMYVIYLIGLLGNIEYKSSNWKKLFVLPIRKELLISSKLLYVLIHLFVAIILFGINTLLFGLIAGVAHPELKLLDFSPQFDLIIWLIYHMFLSVLGIIGLQFILSIFFENILITLAIGLFLMVGSLIAAGLQWEYIEFVPYASPNRFAVAAGTVKEWITKPEWTNLVIFGLSFAFSLFFFKRKTVK